MAQTYYIAPLRCNHCQAISSPNDSLNMYNQIIDEPGIFEVKSGDVIRNHT